MTSRSTAVSSPPGLLLVAGATVASSLLGYALGWKWSLPVLNCVPAYAVLLSMRPGRRGKTVGLLIWWAFWLAVIGVALTLLWPDRAAAVTLNGPAYRAEMRDWLATGVGRESTPSQFLPQHLLHAGLFCALALMTASALSVVMGAVLMNYMSFYVGDLVHHCAGAGFLIRGALLAWNPWSMVRVVSFVVLGVVLAEPLLSRVRGRSAAGKGRLPWIAAGLGGLILDALLKTFLAPHWPGILGVCLG